MPKCTVCKKHFYQWYGKSFKDKLNGWRSTFICNDCYAKNPKRVQ